MTLTPYEELIHDALAADHTGRPNGIRGRDLQEKLNIPGRRLRESIESLIKIHRVPIGGDPVHGYYIIATDDEFQKACHELTARIVALGERLRALETAFRQYVARPRQTSLFDRSGSGSEETKPECA